MIKEGVSMILTIDEIVNRLNPILSNNEIGKAVLFGSYARNQATPESDIDLVIDTEITGLDFVGVMLDVEDALGKSVDLIPRRSIDKTHKIYKNIESEGVTIYEQG